MYLPVSSLIREALRSHHCMQVPNEKLKKLKNRLAFLDLPKQFSPQIGEAQWIFTFYFIRDPQAEISTATALQQKINCN